MKNALIIFFNTDFSKNIPLLEKIHGSRFSDILYVVPDHSSKLRNDYVESKIPYDRVNQKDKLINKARRLARKKNAHELHDNSYDHKIKRVVGFQYFFQDYFWQARERILQMQADWYWFVSDDVLINSNINQDNIFEKSLSKDDLSLISLLHHPSNAWVDWFQGSTQKVTDKLTTLNCFPEEQSKSKYRNDVNQDGPYEENLIAGCSDLFAIHSSKIETFLHYCHQTAQRKVFVELAIPNILLTHCQPVAFIHDYIWDFEINRGDWDKIIEFLRSSMFYFHPVKLSLLDQSQIDILLAEYE